MFQKIQKRKLSISNLFFKTVSESLFPSYQQLQTLLTTILFHHNNPLKPIALNPSNEPHTITLLRIAKVTFSLGINLLCSVHKLIVQSDTKFSAIVQGMLQSCQKLLACWRDLIPLTEDSVKFDLEEIRARLRKIIYQLTFRFTDLNRIVPLVFADMISGYIQFAVETLLTDWGDLFVTKCTGFMMYKLLNTFFFYRGKLARFCLCFCECLRYSPSMFRGR